MYVYLNLYIYTCKQKHIYVYLNMIILQNVNVKYLIIHIMHFQNYK